MTSTWRAHEERSKVELAEENILWTRPFGLRISRIHASPSMQSSGCCTCTCKRGKARPMARLTSCVSALLLLTYFSPGVRGGCQTLTSGNIVTVEELSADNVLLVCDEGYTVPCYETRVVKATCEGNQWLYDPDVGRACWLEGCYPCPAVPANAKLTKSSNSQRIFDCPGGSFFPSGSTRLTADCIDGNWTLSEPYGDCVTGERPSTMTSSGAGEVAASSSRTDVSVASSGAGEVAASSSKTDVSVTSSGTNRTLGGAVTVEGKNSSQNGK
ncbi:uncharacterized protein [Penaeus vannamei]|uniref:uncharacterized protein n=1 Tax=Penaeus vannamei TaxID=6689 RepID=UPI00387F7CFD